MEIKNITLISGSEQGWQWKIISRVRYNGTFDCKGLTHLINSKERSRRDKDKYNIRSKDRKWIKANIPSSIWWFSEIHHDWGNGGRMYLLSKGEHILRHRREKEHGKEKEI